MLPHLHSAARQRRHNARPSCLTRPTNLPDVIRPGDLERLGAISLVTDRLADGRFVEGTVDELFAATEG